MESATKTKLDNKTVNSICVKSLDDNALNVKELTDGWFNTAYDVTLRSGKCVILKVAPQKSTNILRYEKDIMRTEVETMRMVTGKTSVPVPEIYAYDSSHKLIDNEYYFMQKLNGVPYNYIQEKTDEATKEKIEIQLGKYNIAINDISGESFGLYSQVHPKHETWSEAFFYMTKIMLLDAQKYNVDIGMSYEKLDDLIHSIKEVLDCVKMPQLVHWDLWAGNVFVDNDKITGIIDFERALWGDRLMEVFFYSGNNKYFLNGYGIQIDKEPYFNIRTALYSLYMGLVMVTECPFRNFSADHKKWVRGLFDERYKKLLIAIG